MDQEKIRVLIVDDTILYRKMISQILEDHPQIEVVGTASNGKIALARIEQLHPDLITLDIEMPVLNGIETIMEIKKKKLNTAAIMVSAINEEAAKITMKSLENGAWDFITKPSDDNRDDNYEILKNQLHQKISIFIKQREIKQIITGKDISQIPHREKEPVDTVSSVQEKMGRILSSVRREIVAIGISTGGPNALAVMLPQLPKNLNVPIVLVQHMPALFTGALAESLDKKCEVSVRQAVDGEPLESNTVFIAPGGKQMKLQKDSSILHSSISITDDGPENHCKPSVDYLFRSVANVYHEHAIGVIMTGMGADGALGLKLMKRQGAYTIAQDRDSSVVYGMPSEALKKQAVETVLSLTKIAPEIVKEIRR